MHRMLLRALAMSTLGAVPAFLLAAQFVLISEDLSLDERHLGLAVGVFFAAAAIASTPAGMAADRLGPRRAQVLAGVLATCAALLMALYVSSVAALLVALAVAGVSNATLQMTANAALARGIPPQRRGLAFGVKQAAVPVAILLGGLAVPVLGLALGWRGTYGVFAVACALVALGALRRRSAVGETRRRSSGDEGPPRPALLLTAVATTIANGAANSLGAFLPAWAFSLGLSAGQSGMLVAVGAALCAGGRVLSGVAADRRNGRNVPFVAAQMALGAGGFALIAQGELALVVLGTLVAYAVGWSWPGLLMFAIVRIGRDRPATASSAVQAGGFAGGALGPPLFGLLVVTTSYQTAWLVAGAALVVGAGLLMWARRLFLHDLAVRPLR